MHANKMRTLKRQKWFPAEGYKVLNNIALQILIPTLRHKCVEIPVTRTTQNNLTKIAFGR